MNEQEKRAIRQRILTNRRSLSHQAWQALSQTICARLLKQLSVRDGMRIALYFPVQNEVDTRSLISPLLAQNCALYWPIIHQDIPGEIRFASCATLETMRPNRFGIPEPPVEWKAAQDVEVLDVIITPLVAFDPQCHRLGMGGGYYDRCFARAPDTIKRIGVAYQFQCVDNLPVSAWDQALDEVITESSTYRNIS